MKQHLLFDTLICNVSKNENSTIKLATKQCKKIHKAKSQNNKTEHISSFLYNEIFCRAIEMNLVTIYTVLLPRIYNFYSTYLV